MDLHILSTGYVDNRNFPGTGPVGYDDSANFSTAFIVIYTGMFPLSQWLVDGLLVSRLHLKFTHLYVLRGPFLQLYRCYVFYFMNYWVMFFPCLMYVASVGASPICLQ